MFGLMRTKTHYQAIARKDIHIRDEYAHLQRIKQVRNERGATINELTEKIIAINTSLKTEKKRTAALKGHLTRLKVLTPEP